MFYFLPTFLYRIQIIVYKDRQLLTKRAGGGGGGTQNIMLMYKFEKSSI